MENVAMVAELMLRGLSEAVSREARADGVSRAGWQVLWWLHRVGPRSTSQLAATWLRERQEMHRTVHALEGKGLVSVLCAPGGRGVGWQLTEMGTFIAGRIAARVADVDFLFQREFGEEVAAAVKVLERLRDVVRSGKTSRERSQGVRLEVEPRARTPSWDV